MASSAGGPVDPPPSSWDFPAIEDVPPDDLVAVGADLAPGTLLAAYRAGYFPMPLDAMPLDAMPHDPMRPDTPSTIGWWSPEPRGIIEPVALRISRSLRRSSRRFELRVDTEFEAVLDGCADESRENGWIDDQIREAYLELHRLGWVHSVEAWDDEGLAGGLYGVNIGAFFAGESMFHRRTDASKVALVGLANALRPVDGCLLDVQWMTPHLGRLGAVAVSRRTYADRLRTAIALPAPDWSGIDDLLSR